MGSINLAVACSSPRRGWARGPWVGHYGARPLGIKPVGLLYLCEEREVEFGWVCV